MTKNEPKANDAPRVPGPQLRVGSQCLEREKAYLPKRGTDQSEAS